MKSKKFWYGFVIALTILAGVATGVGLGHYYVANASVVEEDYVVHSSAYSSTFFSQSINTFYPGFTSASAQTSLKNWSSLTQTGDKASVNWHFLSLVDSNNLGYVGFSCYYNSANFVNYVNDRSSNFTYNGFNCFTWRMSFENNLFIYDLDWDTSGSYTQAYLGLSVYNPQDDQMEDPFDNTFVSLRMGNYTSSHNPLSRFSGYTNYSTISSGRYNWFSFTNSQGIVITWYVPIYYVSTSTYEQRPYWFYDDSIYYFLDGSANTDDPYYNQGFNDGYGDGYEDGERAGYNIGYNDGYGVGDNAGYERGVNAAHEFTFFNLLGSVVDAPISAFRGLFNFSILGINMADFLASLLTLCIIFLVVKFVFLK